MKMPAKIAAIELEGDEVRVAVVKTGGRKATVLEAHVERAKDTTPEGHRNSLVQAIRDATGRIKGKPSLYVLCVGGQHSMVRSLTVPFRGSRKVAAAVPFELEPYLAVPIDELIVDHCTIREVEGETEVLAVGVRAALLEDQIGLLEEAGVNAEGVTLDVAGLTTLWMENRRNPSGLHAIVHIREHASILAVTYNKSLAYYRMLAIPASRLHEDSAAVSREVRNSLRAFLATWRGEETIGGLTVTGVDLSPAERDGFEDGLQIPVAYERLSEGLKGASNLNGGEVSAGIVAEDEGDRLPSAHAAERPNYWEAAVGAAVSASGGGIGFDFRKGALAPAGAMRAMALHAAFSAGLLGLVVIGFATYAVVDYRRNMAEIDRCGAEVWSIYADTFPDSPIVGDGRLPTDIGGIQSIQAMQDAYEKSTTQGTRVPVELLTRPTFLEILKVISQTLPGDTVQVTDMKIRDNRGQSQTLTIQGEVDEVGALMQAFDELKESPLMEISEDPIRQTKDGGKTAFTINANI